jgi:peptidoglycan/LPS O-acetylase OafA/YrhL
MLNFRRITTQKRFIPQIDGLRFVAIASVVFFHIYSALEGRSAIPPPGPLNLDLPKRGVELFFAISGFILGVPFASHFLLKAPKVRLKQYFLRRLTRLEPPYFLSFPAWALMQWIAIRRPFSDMVPHLLAHCFYLHNFIYGAFPGAVNTVAWSLEVEVQFYCLVPLLSLVFAISNARLRRAVILVAMAILGFASSPLYRTVHFHYFIGYYLPFFLAGFLVCDFYITRDHWKPSFTWDILALCLWPLVWLPGHYTTHIALPFVIVVLYLAAFRGRICSAIFSYPLITHIGGMCYSIYLFHFLVIYAVKHVTAYWHIGSNFWVFFALQSILIWPAILLSCGAFFLLIERPCMDRDWPKKLWSRVRAVTSSARPASSPKVEPNPSTPHV